MANRPTLQPEEILERQRLLTNYVRSRIAAIRSAVAQLTAGQPLRIELEWAAVLGAPGPSRWSVQECALVRGGLAKMLGAKAPAVIEVANIEQDAEAVALKLLGNVEVSDQHAAADPLGQTAADNPVMTATAPDHPVMPPDVAEQPAKTPMANKEGTSEAAGRILDELLHRKRRPT